ncbi:hypothetical protein CAPTEDRAFT_201255 [Capitella teleta]|uniref:Uncharacterized protein n=1 Tax=Capitella teleta TaxID=283909 RepID=R7UUH1_CAPTE|nr:hypothetical protein CAPTEDRAFT_201255 [Capitella teleta]|eukprot:ELU10278.1 hypothetical protein CAPTEDRAFT_201255 [Capitella teleta]
MSTVELESNCRREIEKRKRQGIHLEFEKQADGKMDSHFGLEIGKVGKRRTLTRALTGAASTRRTSLFLANRGVAVIDQSKNHNGNLLRVLINPWSICNKAEDINNFIIEYNIDILVITKTWLTVLECVIKGPIVLRICVVYQPYRTALFMEEFSSYLAGLATSPVHLLVLGDFKLHVDDPLDKCTQDFLTSMSSLGLEQHVTTVTHAMVILWIWFSPHSAILWISHGSQ